MADTFSFREPLQVRKMMAGWEKMVVEKLGPVDEQIEESYHDIPLPDGHNIQAKVWRRKDEASTLRPVILLFHGGGFVAGSPEMCTRPGRELALQFDAVVVSARYRLAPEHTFPQWALDGLDVLQWVIENASKEFGASPEAGLVVGGYSAGAQIAAVLASEARSKDFDHPITGSFICTPWLFMEETVPQEYKHLFASREENDVPPMGKQSIQDMLSNAKADPASPLFCPAHSTQGLKDLPPTYVQVGGKDCLRDDGVVYEMLLRDASVETRLDNHSAVGHESWTVFTDMDAPGAQELKDSTLDAMKWLLKK